MYTTAFRERLFYHNFFVLYHYYDIILEIYPTLNIEVGFLVWRKCGGALSENFHFQNLRFSVRFRNIRTANFDGLLT